MGMPCLKIIKKYLLSQNLQQEAQRTQLLKFTGTLQERNPGICIKPDIERPKHLCKRRLYKFLAVLYQRHTVQCTVLAASAQIHVDAPNKHHTL